MMLMAHESYVHMNGTKAGVLLKANVQRSKFGIILPV